MVHYLKIIMYLCTTELFAHLQADVGYSVVRAKVCTNFM